METVSARLSTIDSLELAAELVLQVDARVSSEQLTELITTLNQSFETIFFTSPPDIKLHILHIIAGLAILEANQVKYRWQDMPPVLPQVVGLSFANLLGETPPEPLQPGVTAFKRMIN